jgi:hypothetical protein
MTGTKTRAMRIRKGYGEHLGESNPFTSPNLPDWKTQDDCFQKLRMEDFGSQVVQALELSSEFEKEDLGQPPRFQAEILNFEKRVQEKIQMRELRNRTEVNEGMRAAGDVLTPRPPVRKHIT